MKRNEIVELVRIANKLDKNGLFKLASEIDAQVKRMAQVEQDYLENPLNNSQDFQTPPNDIRQNLKQYYDTIEKGSREDGLLAQLRREDISEEQLIDMALDLFSKSPWIKTPNDALLKLMNEYSRKGRSYGRGDKRPENKTIGWN